MKTQLAVLKQEVFHLRIYMETAERQRTMEIERLRIETEKKCDLRHS
jgi:hypothetical protein